MSVRESISGILSSSNAEEKRKEVWRAYKRNQKQIDRDGTVILIPYTDSRLNHIGWSAQNWILDINQKVREHGEEVSEETYSLEECEEETRSDIKDDLQYLTTHELDGEIEIMKKGFLILYTTLLLVIISGELPTIINLAP